MDFYLNVHRIFIAQILKYLFHEPKLCNTSLQKNSIKINKFFFIRNIYSQVEIFFKNKNDHVVKFDPCYFWHAKWTKLKN